MRFSKKADVRASVVALAGAATALVLLLSGTALAHAAYESSDPADGATVSSPPSQVTANYTEPLAEGDSYMDVTDPCGRDVGGATSITADSMTVSMSGTAEGEYVVKWRARSTVDNHVTTGDFSFTSNGGDPCPGEETEPEEQTNEKESSVGGSNSSSNTSSGSSGSANSGGNEETSAGNSGGRAGSGNETRSKKAGGQGTKVDDVKGNIVAAPPPDEESDPSTLDGIPMGGLLVTLLLAAVIGAAAGKIYFSLSGEGG